MTRYRFDTDTATHPLDDTRAACEVTAGWDVDGRILNGGYLQALALRAGIDLAADDRVPVAVSTTFAAPARPGPGEIAVTILRRGQRVTAVSCRLSQHDSPVLSSLVTFCSLPDQPPPGPAHPRHGSPHTAMPSVPPAEECLRIPAERFPGPPGLAHLVDYAFVPAQSAWLTDGVPGATHLRVWLSFADRRPVDRTAVCALMDMAPPVSFAAGMAGWAPTLQLQVGLFATPSGGPVLLDLVGRPYDGTVVAEDGTLWDVDGTVLATSRQIALAPRS